MEFTRGAVLDGFTQAMSGPRTNGPIDSYLFLPHRRPVFSYHSRQSRCRLVGEGALKKFMGPIYWKS